MDLSYTNIKDLSVFKLRDFSCVKVNKQISEDAIFRIFWVKDGQVDINIDGILHQLTAHQLLFLTPLHQIEILNPTEQVITLSFNREFYCVKEHDSEVSCYGHLFFGSSDIPVLTLDEKEQASFQLLFQIMQEEFEEKDKIQGEMLQMLLKRMLIKSTRVAKKTLPNPTIPQEQLDIVRQFNVLVEMHFKQKHKVAEYADLLFKSPKTLANVFAQYSKKSPSQMIHERIILEARRLLHFTDKSTKEIAFELGYDDAAHFSKFFKKHVGESPHTFRNNPAFQL